MLSRIVISGLLVAVLWAFASPEPSNAQQVSKSISVNQFDMLFGSLSLVSNNGGSQLGFAYTDYASGEVTYFSVSADESGDESLTQGGSTFGPPKKIPMIIS